MKTLPYFRWFVADAETDERYAAMTDQELGFYHRLLNRSWVNGGLPENLDDLAATMKVARTYLDELWPRVGKCFKNIDGRLFNSRQEEERAYASSKSARSAHAARMKYASTADALRPHSARSADGVPRAYDSGSSSLEGGLGETERDAICAAAERMYALHPKKRNMVLVPGALESAVLSGTPLSEIESCHAAWCSTSAWNETSGRFAPKLDEWIADRGFTKWPEGQEPKPKAEAAPRVIKTDPAGAWWLTDPV